MIFGENEPKIEKCVLGRNRTKVAEKLKIHLQIALQVRKPDSIQELRFINDGALNKLTDFTNFTSFYIEFCQSKYRLKSEKSELKSRRNYQNWILHAKLGL